MENIIKQNKAEDIEPSTDKVFFTDPNLENMPLEQALALTLKQLADTLPKFEIKP